MLTVGPNLNTNGSIFLIVHRATKKRREMRPLFIQQKHMNPQKNKKITAKSSLKQKFTKKKTQLATRAKKNHSTSNHSPYINFFSKLHMSQASATQNRQFQIKD